MPSLPQVQQNSANPNQVDIKLNRETRHERVSQSEALRTFALRLIAEADWLKCAAVILMTCFTGLSLLQVAWLLIPIEPTYHAVIRWTLFIAPIVIIPGWICWVIKSIEARLVERPSAYLLCVGVGLWFSWVFHGIS